MHHIRCLILCFFCYCLNAQTSKPTTLSTYKNEKLKAWADHCDRLLFEENYSALKVAAAKGLTMTPKKQSGYLSLFHFYIGISSEYSRQNDSVVYHLEKSEYYARQYKNPKRLEETLMQLLLAYSKPGKLRKRAVVLAELEKRADTVKDLVRKSNLQSSISYYYINIGEYEKGLAYRLANIRAKRSYLYKGSHDDSINFGVSLVNVGELYLDMKNPEKASEYLAESQAFIKDYKAGIAVTSYDLIRAGLMQNRPEKALKNYGKLTRFVSSDADNCCWSVLIDADLAFGDYYLKNNTTMALGYINHASKLARKYADLFQIAKINLRKGNIYLAQKQYATALEYLKKAEPVTKDDSPENYSALQKSLSDTYAGLKNFPLAYHHFSLYSRLQDKFLNEKAKSNLAKMEAQYQNKKKQGEINMLSAENKIKNLTIKNAEKQRLFLLIGLLLLLVTVGSLVVIYRNKQKSSRILAQKNDEMSQLNARLETANSTKAKLFSIISHDLRSPISHIYQFLDLQKTDPELFSEADRQRHNDRISAAANTVLETMEDLLIWSKSQMQQFTVTNEKVRLMQCIESIKDLMKAQIDKKQIRIDCKFSVAVSLHTDRNILTIILRNILQNAVKYAPENSAVTISAASANEKLVISIADNGPGIPEELRVAFSTETTAINSGQSGLGLTLVKEMADLIRTEVTISYNIPNGTIVSLSIPKSH